MDRKRMDARRQLMAERQIDHPVALDTALSFERLRYDIYPEVRLSARPMPGVPFMLVRFIHNADAFRSESFGQLSCDYLLGCLLHGRWDALGRDLRRMIGEQDEESGRDQVIWICQACGPSQLVCIMNRHEIRLAPF